MKESVAKVTVWHHEVCRVMKNSGPEKLILQTVPRTHERYFSCIPYDSQHLIANSELVECIILAYERFQYNFDRSRCYQ